MSKLKQPYIWPLLLLIFANAIIFADLPPGLRFIAALLLLGFLPGWVWLRALFPKPTDLLERITIAVGLSLATTVICTMLTVYLAGTLSLTGLLLTINAVTLIGLIFLWRLNPVISTRPPDRKTKLIILALLALLIFAAALRLPRLGYAEFHEDEAEALMLGVRLFQGEDYALFLHRKGPAQMLVPVAFWHLTNQITETYARFAFALSSIFSVLTLFLIGRRWFGWQAGLAAGALWAINGYAIAFGRMVQYQALIFFLAPLSIYCLYLGWHYRQTRFQFLGAIMLATSLLAHFDALLLLPAAAYLLIISFRSNRKTRPRHALIGLGLSLILFIFLIALFYIPYILDPEFQNTTSYLANSRVKPGLLYNNLDLLRRLDRDYSSHFYLPILVIGVISFILLWGYQRNNGTTNSQANKLTRNTQHTSPVPHPASRVAHPISIIILLILTASTLWFPGFWQVGQVNLAIVPWLILGAILWWHSPDVGTRTTWLMFGAPLVGYVFLVDDPRTHLYILYPGAVLISGAGWAALVMPSSIIPRIFASRPLRLAVAVIFAVGLIAVTLYTTQIFLQTESTFIQLRERWDGSMWETVYNDLPKPREYFGYPKLEGWKTIGALRAAGHFPGDFRSVNEDFIVPIWYNTGQARSCYNTPAHFFVRLTNLDDPPPQDNYVETGHIQRENELRLQILSQQSIAAENAETYTLEDYVAQFDTLATPQQFTRQSEPEQSVGAQFGPAILFTGFDLPQTTFSPGDTLLLNLYWQALDNPGTDYRAFVHLTDGTTLWAQQDDNPACRLPTSIWRPKQRGVGQFRLQIRSDTPPGRYPLIIGLYQADTLERLKISGGAGQPGDDFLWLGDVLIDE